MPFEEAPKQMAYERVTKENAVDFFVELFRTVSIELGVTIQENPELSFYLAHDPLWSIDMAAALAIVASDNNQNGLMSQIQQLIRLIPVPRYMNTGMFFGTYTSNVAILTNSSRADLGNVMVYVAPLTGKVYYKNQMLLNAKVIDFNQTISNIVGYAEANEVTFNAPYEPYKPNGKSPDVRYRPTMTDETSNKARASVAVETTGEGSAAVEGVTFTAQDVLKKDTENTDLLLALACLANAHGEYDLAARVFDKALNADNRHAYLQQAVLSYSKSAQPEKALVLYQ